MTAELALTTTSLTERLEYARAIAPADLLPPAFRGKPANVLLAMEAGVALRKSAVEIMQNAHVINGKLGFSAEFQRALVLEAGHRIRVYMDGANAIAEGSRSDDPEYQPRVCWTWEMAVEARLTTGPNKENWAKWPRNMLKARATTDLCRDLFPDVIRGFRSVTELQDMEAAPTAVPGKPGDKLRAAAGLPVDDGIVDAEIVTDVTATTVELITPAQLKMLHTLLPKLGLVEREDALEYLGGIVGHDVESSKLLTLQEASLVLDTMTAAVGNLDA